MNLFELPHPVFSTVIHTICLFMLFLTMDSREVSKWKARTFLILIPWSLGFWATWCLYLKKGWKRWPIVLFYYIPLICWFFSPFVPIAIFFIKFAIEQVWFIMDWFIAMQLSMTVVFIWLIQTVFGCGCRGVIYIIRSCLYFLCCCPCCFSNSSPKQYNNNKKKKKRRKKRRNK